LGSRDIMENGTSFNVSHTEVRRDQEKKKKGRGRTEVGGV